MRLLLALALLPLAVPSMAQGVASPGETATTAPTAAGQPDKKICKVDEEDTESRIRRRICRTEAEWNARSKKRKAPSN